MYVNFAPSKASFSVQLSQVTLIDPSSEFHQQTVDIAIENGAIQSITPATIGDSEVFVSPGWVDCFADYREPGYEQKETIDTGLKAAAAGGFTEVLLAPNTQPAISTKSIVQYVLQKGKGHVSQLHPLGAVSKDIEGKSLAEMLDMHAQGAVAFTDGWQPIQNAGLLMKALEYVRAFDGVILQIPEDKNLSAGGLMHEGPLSTLLGLSGIPEEAETLMVHRDIEMLRYAKSRLHLTGISTAASVQMIRAAKAEGLDLTCSVTPYHLALTDEALKNYESNFKTSPPLRPEKDRQALIAALADGTIDCIATHHRPQDWDAMQKELEYAGWGMALQEVAFPMIWEAVKDKVSLERLVDALSVRPRAIFGLPAAGIAANGTANLTIFTTKSGTPNPANSFSLAYNNPFKGRSFSAAVNGVVRAGQAYFNQD